MTALPPLPGFSWSDLYKPLHDALWPANDDLGEMELLDEPPALLKYVEYLTPDDEWLNPGSEKSDLDAMDVDHSVIGGHDGEGEGEGEDPEGEDPNDYNEVDGDRPPKLRYINLDTHPNFLQLSDLIRELQVRKEAATFLLRHEYSLLMRYAIRMASGPIFLALGFALMHPGKSFGSYYFLFRLLAMGQPVFFIDSLTNVYYFCSDGVQETQKIPAGWPEVVKAISAQEKFERVQTQLARALHVFDTRSVAGKVVEGLKHRALTRKIQFPDVIGAGAIAGTLELIGKAENFSCKADISQLHWLHPNLLYSHSGNFATMLRILSILRRAYLDVLNSWEVLYCLVGTDPYYVEELVVQAKQTLAELKKFNPERLCKELTKSHTEITHMRLSKFRVVGYTFDFRQGFKEYIIKTNSVDVKPTIIVTGSIKTVLHRSPFRGLQSSAFSRSYVLRVSCGREREMKRSNPTDRLSLQVRTFQSTENGRERERGERRPNDRTGERRVGKRNARAAHMKTRPPLTVFACL
ncbi:hypothetical protein CPB85DRAFT_1454920 [Mucidula mucida]|nr:hypothetical protein CPB85DRAFT_1454920 [Mucidula mucida]